MILNCHFTLFCNNVLARFEPNNYFTIFAINQKPFHKLKWLKIHSFNTLHISYFDLILQMGYISRLSCSRYAKKCKHIQETLSRVCSTFVCLCTPFLYSMMLQNTFLLNAFRDIFLYTFTYIQYFSKNFNPLNTI